MQRTTWLADRHVTRSTSWLRPSEALCALAIALILITLAWSTVSHRLLRLRTLEAKTQLAKLVNASSSFFQAEHPAQGSTALIDAGEVLEPRHHCPHPRSSPSGGSAGLTPTLDVNCNLGPGGRCVPALTPTCPGTYDVEQWTANPMWHALGYMQVHEHAFHYDYHATNEPDGDRCQFTAQAFADLDNDGVYSTYARGGIGDARGIVTIGALSVSAPLE